MNIFRVPTGFEGKFQSLKQYSPKFVMRLKETVIAPQFLADSVSEQVRALQKILEPIPSGSIPKGPSARQEYPDHTLYFLSLPCCSLWGVLNW